MQCSNRASKTSPRPLSNFGNSSKQPMHARNSSDFSFLFWCFLTWFFPLHPVVFFWKAYLKEKQKEPGTSYQSLFGLRNMLKKFLYSDLIYHLDNFDDLMQSGFLSYSKILDLLIYAIQFTTLYSFVPNCRGEYKKLNISWFLNETKSVFHSFWNAFFWYNIKLEHTSFNTQLHRFLLRKYNLI